MKKEFLVSIFFSFLFTYSIAQKPATSAAQKKLPIAADCKDAIKLSSTRKVNYGPTIAPKGFGKVMDIKACDDQDRFTFEKEHNSAWYYFIVQEDGDVIFEVTSVNPKNDYDFMLYKWPTDSCFCDNVKQQYLLPVRTNLSHSEKKENVPITGLSALAENKHVPIGPGEAFSQSLTVRRGERYYLVLDNVHPKGEGHTIQIYYLKEITIGGTVVDENKKPVPATVWVEDAKGQIISAVRCNAQGKYIFSTKIKDDEFYTLLYSGDSSFITCRQIILGDFSKTKYAQKDLKTILHKLVPGKKYILDGIAYNKTSRLLPSSYSALDALYRLMMKYPRMSIQIEGHVNNPLTSTNTGADKQLGQDRANDVYNYLLGKGIVNRRMTTASFGSLFMLYPKPNSPSETEANNRVEIFFLPEANK